MRTNIFGLTCLLLSASSSSMAFSPVQGWYVGGIALVSYAPSLNYYAVDLTTSPVTDYKGELDYRIGGGGGGQLGYRCAPWRVEAEILFNLNSYSKLTINGTEIKRLNNSNAASGYSLRGDTYFVGGMLNGYYDLYQVQINQDSQIIPYIGVGLGYVHVQNELRLYNSGVLAYGAIKESSNEAAAQVIIGAQYFADDFTSVGLDYRYVTTGKVGNSDERYQVHTANLTLNFAFDDSDYK